MAEQNRINYKLARAFGAELRRLRLLADLSQGILASRAAMSGSLISRYESGDCCPSLDSLCMLAVALECDPGDLLPSREGLIELLGMVGTTQGDGG